MSSSTSNITIRNLTGDWVIDKSKSTNIDAALKLQGIGWLRRKAVTSGTITLKLTHTTPTDIKAQQGLRGIFPGVEQSRFLNWTETSHVDAVSGAPILVRSRFVRGVRDKEGRMKPVLNLETSAGEKGRVAAETYLGAAVSVPVSAETVDAHGEEARERAFVQDFIRCEEGGWCAEQLWAVESIDGGLFLTCKAVVTKGDSMEKACQVYQVEAVQ